MTKYDPLFISWQSAEVSGRGWHLMDTYGAKEQEQKIQVFATWSPFVFWKEGGEGTCIYRQKNQVHKGLWLIVASRKGEEASTTALRANASNSAQSLVCRAPASLHPGLGLRRPQLVSASVVVCKSRLLHWLPQFEEINSSVTFSSLNQVIPLSSRLLSAWYGNDIPVLG